MLFSTLKQFNWVDIFVVIILLRIGYVAIRNGLPVELFKLLGTLSAIYLSLHYYALGGDFLASRIGIIKIPAEIFSFIAFIVLAVGSYFIFVLLRGLLYRFVKMEATPRLNKWGGFILGILRWVLCASLLMFTFALSPLSYFETSVKNAYSAKGLGKIAPAVYTGLWNGVMSKFMAKEKFNEAIREVQENFSSK